MRTKISPKTVLPRWNAQVSAAVSCYRLASSMDRKCCQYKCSSHTTTYFKFWFMLLHRPWVAIGTFSLVSLRSSWKFERGWYTCLYYFRGEVYKWLFTIWECTHSKRNVIDTFIQSFKAIWWLQYFISAISYRLLYFFYVYEFNTFSKAQSRKTVDGVGHLHVLNVYWLIYSTMHRVGRWDFTKGIYEDCGKERKRRSIQSLY